MNLNIFSFFPGIGSKAYKVFLTKLNYDDAKKSCRDKDGRLAMPKTRAIQERILHELPKPGTYLVGMTKQRGVWLFDDGTRVPLRGHRGYQAWGQGQPDNNGWWGESCAGIRRIRRDLADWNDVRCSGWLINYNYICETEEATDFPTGNLKEVLNEKVKPNWSKLQRHILNCFTVLDSSCLRPVVPASVLMSRRNEATHRAGTTLTFSCADQRLELNGNSPITCREDGTWDREPPNSCCKKRFFLVVLLRPSLHFLRYANTINAMYLKTLVVAKLYLFVPSISTYYS